MIYSRKRHASANSIVLTAQSAIGTPLRLDGAANPSTTADGRQVWSHKMAKRKTRSSTSSSSAATSIQTDKSMSVTVKSGKRKKSGRKAKTTASKKKAARIDAKKPKKPPTAFFFFLEDFRKEYQEQNPDIKSMRDIGKACGEKWKTMKYEEKVQYYDVATVKRAEFDIAMANFIKKKENGEFDEEDSELDDDSDFE